MKRGALHYLEPIETPSRSVAVLEAISKAPAKSWVYQTQVCAAVIGDRTAVLSDAQNLTISSLGGVSISAGVFLDRTFSQFSCLSARADMPPSSVPVLVLNGPEALEYLKPGDYACAVVLLEWSEVDQSIRNALAPWLDADEPALQTLQEAAFEAPASWQVVTTLIPMRAR